MKKIKVFSLVLMLIMLLSCTSCKRISQSKFLDIVNEPMENYTCEMNIKMKVKYQGTSSTVPMPIYMEVNEDEVYTSMEYMGEKAEVYYKLVGDQAEVWINDGYGWEKQGNVDAELAGTQAIFPSESIEKGDFKYRKGQWVGNVKKIQDKVEDAISKNLENMQGMSGLDDVEFEIEEYNIVIEDGEISEITMVITFEMESSGQTIDVEAKYNMEFSKIGNTKVTKPDNA